MNIEYKEQAKPKTINEVCGTNDKGFQCYIEAKNSYLQRRDEAAIKRMVESVSWQMGRVA